MSLLCLATGVTVAEAQTTNLLVNGDLAQGTGQRVPGWTFSQWNFNAPPNPQFPAQTTTNTDNQWLGCQALKDVAVTNSWTTYTGQAVAPENAARIGVRLGTHGLGIIEVYFTDVALTEVTP